MLWYIFVCSMIGGLSVSVTTGLGAAIVTTAQGDNQVCCLSLFVVLSLNSDCLLVQVLVHLLPPRIYSHNTERVDLFL